MRTGRQLVTVAGFERAIKATCIRPSDGQLLATDGGTLKVYDPDKKELVENVKISSSAYSGQSATISPNGLILATGNSYAIHLWNLRDYNEMPKLSGDSIPWSMVFSPDNRHLISGHNGTLHVWDTKVAQRKISHSVGSSHYVKCLGVSSDGTLVAADAGFKEVAVVEVNHD